MNTNGTSLDDDAGRRGGRAVAKQPAPHDATAATAAHDPATGVHTPGRALPRTGHLVSTWPWRAIVHM